MKHLLLPFILSLGIHALFMSLDTTRFTRMPPVTPQPDLITISLVGRQPKGDPTASAARKPSETNLSKQKVSHKKEAAPSEAVIEKAPPLPAKQKHARPAVKPAKKIVSPSKAAGQRSAVQEQNNRATESRPDASASGGALAIRGDPPAAAGLIMARPLYRKNPKPRYPLQARKKGYEGEVILDVLVDGNGTVKDLRVFKTSGFEILDQSALSSVRKWLFEPAVKNGKAAKMWVRVPVRFQLKY